MGAARPWRPQCPPDFLWTGFAAAWHGENARLSRRAQLRARSDWFAERRGWADRIDRGHPFHDRPVYAAGRLRSLRLHGGRLFHGACQQGILSGIEPRRTWRALVLWFSLFSVR